MLKRKPPTGDVRRVAPIERNSRGSIVNKVGYTVQFESHGERRHLLRTDRDPHVKDYRSQPLHILHDDSGEAYDPQDDQNDQPEQKLHTYVPDFKVWKDDGSIEIHEITLSERRCLPNAQRREKAAQKYCDTKGWSYRVYTEKDLPSDTEATNLIELYMFRPTVYARPDIALAIHEKLSNEKRLSLLPLIEDISQKLSLPVGEVTPYFYHLLWHGKIDTDLTILIADEGRIAPDVSVWIPL